MRYFQSVLILVGLATSAQAWAAPAQAWTALWGESSPTGHSFSAQEELRATLSPSARDQAAQATVRLVGDDGSHCSASVLSPEGYLLTALHCVERCLDQHHLLERFNSPYVETLSFRTLSQPKSGTFCKGFSLPDQGRSRIELVHLGPGVVNFVDYHPIDRLSQQEFEKLRTLRGDFAILRAAPEFPLLQASEKMNCAEPSSTAESLRSGSALYAIGFPLQKRPSKTSGGVRGNDRGPAFRQRVPETPQVLAGHLATALASNPVILQSRFNARVLDRLESFHNAPGVKLAHLDIYPGLSGGPIVNDRGQLVGTVSGVVDETRIDAEFVPNNGVFTPLPFVYAELTRVHDSAFLNRVFSCKNKP